MAFTDEVDNYFVATLDFKDFRPTGRTLPPEYSLISTSPDRVREKEGLQRCFRGWRTPFERTAKGWRDDGCIYLVHQVEGLVGGFYLIDTNDYDVPNWGQLHYSWIVPAHRGHGGYSVMFEALVARAREWGLAGLFMSTDRESLPNVIQRWGAKQYEVIQKPPPPKKKPLLRRAAGKLYRLLTGKTS
jgi:GNAT superfamily N-acetyltransferase